MLDFGGEGGGEEGEAVVLAVPSLEDDCRTREQFKYDYGLEKNSFVFFFSLLLFFMYILFTIIIIIILFIFFSFLFF